MRPAPDDGTGVGAAGAQPSGTLGRLFVPAEPRQLPGHRWLKIGLRAAHTLQPGSTLVWSDLIESSGGVSSETLMSDVVAHGQRATSILIESATFPGLLSTGDRVDVFYSAIQGGISRNTTVLLAQNSELDA